MGQGEPQVCHNDFDHDEEESANFFDIATKSESASLYTCLGSHHFVFYPDDIKERLAKMMRMKEVTIPSNALFMGHEFLQHAAGGGYCLRYHIKLL